MKLKTCKHCLQKFEPKSALIPYCSPMCQRKAESVRKAKKNAKSTERKRLSKEKKMASVPYLAKQCDMWWSKAVRSIGYCEYCNTPDFLNAHHIYGRSNTNTRWEFDNGICLCAKHHTFSNEFSAHRCPSAFTYWLESRRGRPYMDKLHTMSQLPMKVNAEYLQRKIVEFQIVVRDSWHFE